MNHTPHLQTRRILHGRALAKYDRGRADTKDVITELADVSIMVEQMAMLFGKEEFEAERERKLKRLQEKINEASNL